MGKAKILRIFSPNVSRQINCKPILRISHEICANSVCTVTEEGPVKHTRRTHDLNANNANVPSITDEILADILRHIRSLVGSYEDFANIAHFLRSSCAYNEAFETCLSTNDE